ncbi:MAG: DUF4190 domain-containing protein [Lachnospiraceae bacterium]|nr:DUF4190 domain-containing protein [Lachnospiraceae bacterium]
MDANNMNPQVGNGAYNAPQYQVPGGNDPGKGLAAASLVCGILGLCTGWLYGVGCVLGIVGVVLAVVSGNKSQAAGFPKSGLATAGLVCGIIAIVTGAGCLICTVCTGAAVGAGGLAGVLDSL